MILNNQETAWTVVLRHKRIITHLESVSCVYCVLRAIMHASSNFYPYAIIDFTVKYYIKRESTLSN